MISYSLECANGHDFESLFKDAASFDRLMKSGALQCPHCGSADISKGLSSPRVSSSKTRAKAAKEVVQKLAQNTPPKELPAGKGGTLSAPQMIAAMKQHIEAHSEDVGTQFPEEARRIHYGETETRSIYGKASGADVKDLVDEGINVLPLPWIDTADKN